MTARIDLADGSAEVSVRVSGQLDGPAARELRALCRSQSRGIVIDLEELVSADRDAVEMLRELETIGARIVGASPYIEMLLNGNRVGRPAAPANEPDEDAAEQPGQSRLRGAQ